jgi:hypothetical protein
MMRLIPDRGTAILFLRRLPESCNAKLLAKRAIIATGADCHRPEAEGRERLSIGLQGKK